MYPPIRKIFYSILILVAVCFSSCREEIIPPGNPAGNLNEPVLESNVDYYTFKINASNVSFTQTDYTYFNSLKNYFTFSLIDHKSGSIDVLIISKTKQILYDARFSDDLYRTTVVIEGSVPEYISIKLNDCTGKINLQLSRY